jgi:hypothetical protein
MDPTEYVSYLTRGRKQIQFPKRCVFSLLFRKNPDDGECPKTQYLCVLYTIVRTL